MKRKLTRKTPASKSTESTHERWCPSCQLAVIPHEPLATPAVFDFDITAAMNTLLLAWHNEPGHKEAKSGRAKALWDGYMVLVRHVRTLGPERASEQAYVDSIKALQATLARFVRVASDREVLEARKEARTLGLRSKPRPVEVTRHALRHAEALSRSLRALEHTWAFPSDGRTLRGTVREARRPRKGLLELTEWLLHEGGLSHREIAMMDLDGELATSGVADERRVTAAKDRVRKRVQAETKRRRARERSIDPALVEDFLSVLRGGK